MLNTGEKEAKKKNETEEVLGWVICTYGMSMRIEAKTSKYCVRLCLRSVRPGAERRADDAHGEHFFSHRQRGGSDF